MSGNSRLAVRRDGRRGGSARILGLALLTASAFAAGGCASARALMPAGSIEPLPFDSPVLSRTLQPEDAWLRHYLMLRDPAAALSFLRAEDRPRQSDILLRSLQEAIIARSAGDYSTSNALLESADLEIERRKVLSVSQTAGSYLVSDRLLSYLPAVGEIAMIPYYRMMNYLALGEAQNAAVEARRISAQVDDAPAAALGGCQEAAMLNYASGLAFELAGEVNDALVSVRRAEAALSECEGVTTPGWLRYDISRLAGSLGFNQLVDTVAGHYLSASTESTEARGEVLVLLEHGFVAHRAEGAIHLPIFDHEIEDLEGDDGEEIAEVAAAITARLLRNFSEKGYHGASWDDHPAVQAGQALRGAHIVRLAWPELRGDSDGPVQLRIIISNDTVPASRFSDLSGVAREKLEAERAASLTRLVTRGVAKFLASRAVENKAGKQGGELLGFVAGRLSNLAVNATERADTRAWTLLPDQIAMARLSLPVGEHELTVQSYDRRRGVWVDVDLGKVTVEEGGLTILNRRVWRDEASDGWDGDRWDDDLAHLGVAGADGGSLLTGSAAELAHDAEDATAADAAGSLSAPNPATDLGPAVTALGTAEEFGASVEPRDACAEVSAREDEATARSAAGDAAP